MIIVISFCKDHPQTTAGRLPEQFSWLTFASGEIISFVAFGHAWLQARQASGAYAGSTEAGRFDAVLDRYADAFVIFGLTLHVFSATASSFDLFVGFLAIIGSFMNSYTADKYDRLMKAKFSRGKGIRIGRDVRIFLIFVGAICNMPRAILFVLAIL